MSSAPRIVSLTPAVFHLPERVNAVSRAYGVSPIVPRGPRFAPLVARVLSGIQDALAAPRHQPILLTGSGSTAIAAVLGSCLRPDERLLVVRNGAYGDRILEFAKRLGQPVVDMDLPYGERPDTGAIDGILARGEANAVAVVYGGTSTCTLNPVAEIGEACQRRGAKLLVDGVSALFVEPMDLDRWNIAAVMGSCNKGLHSHPNLTMALVRDDLLEDMKAIAPRAPSLELRKAYESQAKGAHPYTIDPMSVLQVEAALAALADEGGVRGRHETYLRRAELLRAGFEKLGLRIARWEGQPLASIGTALHIPAGRSYDAMADRLATEVVEDHLFEIYAAQGKLSNELFRIFHMGDYPIEVYEVFLRALARVV
jgi:2-aminoethylphosphonate-pyruvate transaminase